MLQGYRTIIVNIIMMLAAWLNAKYQIVIDPEAQTAAVVTVITAGNIILRFLTKTPVGKKEGTINGQSDQAASKEGHP